MKDGGNVGEVDDGVALAVGGIWFFGERRAHGCKAWIGLTLGKLGGASRGLAGREMLALMVMVFGWEKGRG
jgi:hypothetical protein